MTLYKVSFWTWRTDNNEDFIIFDDRKNAEQFMNELKEKIRFEVIK